MGGQRGGIRTCADCLQSFWGDYAFELHRVEDRNLCLRPQRLGMDYSVFDTRIVWFSLTPPPRPSVGAAGHDRDTTGTGETD